MKKVSFVLAAIASLSVASIAAAQATSEPKSKMESHHMSSGWKELDAFHTLLAATWHPIEKGDYKPAREKAASMATAAETWAASAAPAKCDAKAGAAAKAIAPETRDLAKLIADGVADSTIKSKLKAVHDRFEEAEHACMGHK